MTTAEIDDKKITDNKKLKKALVSIAAEDYLKKEFPLLEKSGEYKTDFNFLWETNKYKYYRVNFWAKKEDREKRELSWLQSNQINRSYFIKLIKDGINWKYEII